MDEKPMHTPGENMATYTRPTWFIDSDAPEIIEFAHQYRVADDDRKTAVNIYYAVRDTIMYDPYRINLKPEFMRASYILSIKRGYCVAKALLLTACLRAVSIPARLCFADVKNHITTEKLRNLMQTDIFYYHGYTEIHLGGKWVKATPAFNLSLCRRFGIKPLEFDGREDAIFHEYDEAGRKHMEYVTYHGTYDDLPLDEITASLTRHYPHLMNYTASTEKGNNSGAGGKDAFE